MKKTIIIIVILFIVGVGAYYALYNNPSPAPSYMPAINTATQTNQQPTAPATTNPSAPHAPTSVTINIKNFAFNPSTITVKTGTKVTWVNSDSTGHTVTSNSSSILNSGILSPGQSYSFTFTNPGSISYHCTIHSMMKGTIVVTN